jgi:hypothetical protein
MNVRLVVMNTENCVVGGKMLIHCMFTLWFEIAVLTNFSSSHLYYQRWTIVDFSSF